MGTVFLYRFLGIVVLMGMIFAGATASAVQWGPQRLSFVGGPAGGNI
jgi:hypothetical protein